MDLAAIAPFSWSCGEHPGRFQVDGREFHPFGLGDHFEFGRGCVREAVEPAVDAFEDAALAEASEVRARDARRVEVARADGPHLGEFQEYVDLRGRRLRHGRAAALPGA